MMASLRTKILGTQALTITVTVLLLGSISYFLMTHALLSLQQHNLERLAETSARDIGRNLNDLQNKFSNIVISRDLHRGSDLPLAKYLGKHLDRFPELTLLNQQGHEELRLLRQLIVSPNDLRDWSDSDLFQQAMSNPNDIIISPVSNHPELGTPTVSFAIAQVQYFGDQFMGLLIGSIPLEHILAQIEKPTDDVDGFLVVMDSQQRILYAPDDNPVLTPLTAVTSTSESHLRDSIHSAPSGFLRETIFDQDTYLAFQTDPISGWTIMAVLPTEVFMTEPNRLRNVTLLICLALLSGGLLVALRITNRLTLDIDHLTDFTHQIAAGNLDSRVSVTSQDEIGILGAAFNAMTDQLARSKEARDHLDTILQSIIDPLLVTDNNGRIQRFNNAAIKMLQYDRENILGTHIDSIFTEEFQPAADNSLLQLVQKTPLQNHETYVRSGVDKKIPVLLSCSFVKMATESESGLVVILKDISKQKSTEEALNSALTVAENTRDQVDAILRSVADGLIVTDTKQDIVLMNRVTEKFFGVTSEDLLDQPLKNLIPHQAVLDQMKNKLEQPSSETAIEFAISRPSDNTPFIILARSAPVQSKDGKISGLITSLRNVTEERKMERIKTEFISTAAHELNTPIATIMGFTDLLLNTDTHGGFSTEQREEFLKEIFEKTDVLSRIVSDLLDLSRMETGQAMPLQKSLTNINNTVLKVTHCFQISDTGQQIELDLDEMATTEILVDQQRIIQVLENLINNAIKYSPAGSRIEISTRLNDKQMLISITDQGTGMTSEQVAKVFDKFYRVDSSNTSVSGLGMGMSIVQSIVQSHDGTIDISSTPGAGTTVTFGLPLNDPVTLQ